MTFYAKWKEEVLVKGPRPAKNGPKREFLGGYLISHGPTSSVAKQ